MKFTPTSIAGAYLVQLERIEDVRGFFARSWCREEFKSQKISSDLVQCNISYNTKKGTLRGMHFQTDPKAEDKLVRCTLGSIYDVILDLRPESPTHLKWEGFELTSQNRDMLYIPKGLAHGFQTLEDETEVFYQMSEFFAPECASGVLWNDPAFNIQWPLTSPIVSDKDQSYPSYKEAT